MTVASNEKHKVNHALELKQGTRNIISILYIKISFMPVFIDHGPPCSYAATGLRQGPVCVICLAPTSSPLDRLVANSVVHHIESCLAAIAILMLLWTDAHTYTEADPFLDGLPSRAEARQPRGLENHSARIARRCWVRELCCHETTMQ